MTTYRVTVDIGSTDLSRDAAFGDHETWFADRREAERVCRELSESGDWPEGQRPIYRIVETDEEAWEWGTGFSDGEGFVGPSSRLFATREAALTDAVAAGYGDDSHLIIIRVPDRSRPIPEKPAMELRLSRTF